jgi:CBS domain-containing protein
MASTTIVREVVNFLKMYPPFNNISENDLSQLAVQIKLQYVQKDEYIFRQADHPYPYFFVVKKGNIRIVQDTSEAIDLIDTCDEGDVFGVRALLAGDNYIASAQAEEDSLLYEIPIEGFQKLLEKYPKVTLYFVAGFASGITVLKPENLANTQKAHTSLNASPKSGLAELALDTLQISIRMRLIACSPNQTIREAAQMMTQYNVGSLLIIDEDKKPLGIITDADFRKKVVNQAEVPVNQAVSSIMSNPVKTIKPDANLAEITMLMARHKITHLCVTEDGTPQTPAISVISQRDVVTAQGNNPAVLIKQILQSEDPAQLRHLRDKADELVKMYLAQEVGIPFISYIITEINDVLLEKATQIALQQLDEAGLTAPPLQFCFMSLGSEGRKEQFLRTDQDNALIYENPPEDIAEAANHYFLALGKAIIDILVECGFEKCPADMMASNPLWCQPIAAWQSQFRQWISEPDTRALLFANIFFDFRPISGEAQLAEDLKSFIFVEIEKSQLFLPFLAKNALQNPPPLSFFRQFIVEKSGEHKNEFDFKARAMMPLADAARVLAYEFKLTNSHSTFERFNEVAQLDENLQGICEAAAMAYEILLKQRAIFGFKNQNSGRFINPDDLNKLERQTIRNIFKTIEKIQQTLNVRYRLDFIRS